MSQNGSNETNKDKCGFYYPYEILHFISIPSIMKSLGGKGTIPEGRLSISSQTISDNPHRHSPGINGRMPLLQPLPPFTSFTVLV